MPVEYSLFQAKWEVLWVTTKGGKRIVSMDFDDDFVAALELYLKAKQAEKPLATLRCKNVGFPPPEKCEGKMAGYNKQGVWWCPYCMQLRRFEKRGWTEVDDTPFSSEPTYFCPICDISQYDGHVIRYNPLARKLQNARRTRGRKRSGRRRKRR